MIPTFIRKRLLIIFSSSRILVLPSAFKSASGVLCHHCEYGESSCICSFSSPVPARIFSIDINIAIGVSPLDVPKALLKSIYFSKIPRR